MNKKQLIAFWIGASLFVFLVWNPKIFPIVSYSYYPTSEYYELIEKERESTNQRLWDENGRRIERIDMDFFVGRLLEGKQAKEDRKIELKNNPRYFRKISRTTYYSLVPEMLIYFIIGAVILIKFIIEEFFCTEIKIDKKPVARRYNKAVQKSIRRNKNKGRNKKK